MLYGFFILFFRTQKKHLFTLRGLESQIAGLAIDTAAKVIGEQAGSLDNAKLYDEFLNKAGDAHDTDIN